MIWIAILLLVVLLFLWMVRQAASRAGQSVRLAGLQILAALGMLVALAMSLLVAVPAGHVGVPVILNTSD